MEDEGLGKIFFVFIKILYKKKTAGLDLERCYVAGEGNNRTLLAFLF